MTKQKSKAKFSILPKLALSNIKNNAGIYFPYIGVSIFAMFTYFSFDMILRNDIMDTLPRASYAKILISIGFALLNIILLPFLYYTNSYVIKQRKKEIGLYNILGLEKKHIGILMLLESLVIYAVVALASIALGILLSKLIMLLLVYLTKVNIAVGFSVSVKAITDLLIFYAVIMVLNLFVNLWQVGKARPIELLSNGTKIEKEPKHIVLTTIIGIISLGAGYFFAAVSQVDSMIFVEFFLAVLLVVIGTYCLFTAGSILLLKRLKKTPGIYYKADNFISVSGMLSRMKKNAASLSNICIFSTMVIITTICTLIVMTGVDSISDFTYPRSYIVNLSGRENIENSETQILSEISGKATKNNIMTEDFIEKKAVIINTEKTDEGFKTVDKDSDYANVFKIHLMTVEDFNKMQHSSYSLEEGQAIVFSSGADFNSDEIIIGNECFKVISELKECSYSKKSSYNAFLCMYIVVLASDKDIDKAAAAWGKTYNDLSLEISMNPIGEEAAVDTFVAESKACLNTISSEISLSDERDNIIDESSMYGGLVFIGLFFGMIFMICLVVIMYYKQIAEGIEDQRNFEIMKKVGMSDEEVKKAISKQIRLVFGLPLAGAIIHTVVGMRMVVRLMAAINFFNISLMVLLTIIVCVVFAGIYLFCYKKTCAAYYRIVR